MRKPFGQKQTKPSKADKVMVAAKRTMPKILQYEGYEWIDRPEISFVVDTGNKRVVVNNGTYVLQYDTMSREDYHFTFTWENIELKLDVGVQRRLGEPYPFCIAYARFKTDVEYRFQSTEELKAIFSIIAMCLENFSSSIVKHTVKISMSQSYKNILSDSCSEYRSFNWKAIL